MLGYQQVCVNFGKFWAEAHCRGVSAFPLVMSLARSAEATWWVPLQAMEHHAGETG